MKRNLLKAIGISFLIFVVLSWIIPVGTYAGGKFTNNGIDAVGIFDLFAVPVQTLLTFTLYAVLFACIGGFYGVMKKTGALDEWVQRASNRFSSKEKGFLIFTILLFVILSSVTGLMLPLFVLVPLFAMILFALGYDKITVLTATVGSILVGGVVSTYGFNVTGYTKNILALDMNSQIIAKLILFVFITAAFIFFVLKCAEIKKVKKDSAIKEAIKESVIKEEKKTKTTKTTSKTKSATRKTTAKKNTKSTTKNMAVSTDIKKVKNTKGVNILPLVVIFVLMLIVTMVGMYNWYYSFGIEAFNNIHTAIMGVKIGDFPIFENLLSGISQLGYWGNNEFIVMMVIASILIAFIYKLSVHEYVESFIAGVKKIMPTALYAALASVILTVLYQAMSSGTGTIVDTMANTTMGLTKGFNVLTTGITALYGSFFFNDLYYLLSSLQPYIAGFGADSIGIAGLLTQSVYCIAMMIFPTSVILIAGLSYFDVSYKSWFKYIWKFALAAFLIVLLVCAILTLI